MSTGDCWFPSSMVTVNLEMGFGDAFICQTPAGENYMITHLRISDDSDVVDDEMSNIQKFMSMRHDNLVRAFDYNKCGRLCKVAMEYNDLHLGTFLPDLKRTMVKTFLFQLISGVQQYHLQDLVHLDIRPQNILVYGEEKIKIANYKLAFVSGTIKGNKEVNGCYRAPEILYSYPSSERKPAVDMWSIGCIFAEMLMGKPLFSGPSIIDRMHSIHSLLGNPDEDLIPDGSLFDFVSSFPVKPPKDLSEEFPDLEAYGVDLLSKLLRLNPMERLEAGEALKHPYFDGI